MINNFRPSASTLTLRSTAAVLAALAIYAYFYFWICGLPVIGHPTFRIDYLATTVTRGDEPTDFIGAILHSRPVSALYVSAQAAIANAFLDGQTRYMVYLLQHAGLFAYFFAIKKVVESVFSIRLGFLGIVLAWMLYAITPVTMDGVYKLETIVGTLSMLFGSVSMLFLLRWREKRGPGPLIGFLLCYSISILAKEDFALPPIILLGWYMLRDGGNLRRLKDQLWRYRVLIIGMVFIVGFFWLFNGFLIKDRAFTKPVDHPQSPYFMSLAPASLLEVAGRYTVGLGHNATLLFYLYSAVSALAIALRVRWRETALVLLMVAGLMAPYLIMPNHVFGYYSIKWLAFEALTLVVLLQLILRHPVAVQGAWVALGTIVFFPVIAGTLERTHRFWHLGNYLRTRLAISANIHETLHHQRAALNRLDRVAVVGIGPRQIEQSPWQSNGETSFYLTGDLHLRPDWLVFVKGSDAAYTIGKDRPGTSAEVDVLDAKSLAEHRDIHALVFREDGRGRLVDLADEAGFEAAQEASGLHSSKIWRARPGVALTAEPATIEDCPGSGSRQVRVNWDATAATRSSVEIWIDEAGRRKLWHAAGAEGSAVTGPWARGGMTFHVLDGSTRKPLATLKLGSGACQAPGT